MKQTQITFTPDTHFIDSIRNTRISYAEALSELIDNGFDAGATEIAIRFGPDSIHVSDNGRGCEDLSAMLALGRHKKSESTRLGRYGVGLKNAAIGMGDLLEIKSRRNGIQRKVVIGWDTLTNWSAVVEEIESKQVGTEISISQITKGRVNHNQLKAQLGFTFRPALVSGKSITIDIGGVQAVEPELMPELENVIQEEVEWGDGLSFKVMAGIIKPGQPLNMRKSFIVQYEHRVLFDTDEPCCELSASQRFIAVVELRGKWPLFKHKDGLSDKTERLYSELYDICEPLLKAVHDEGECIELSELAAELEQGLCGVLGRERRSNGSRVGPVEEKETGRKRKTAEVVHINQGDSKQRNSGRSGGVVFNFGQLGSKIGQVSSTKKRIQITLNQDHPAVVQWRRDRDRQLLKHLAIALLASHQSRQHADSPQMVMPSLIGDTDHDTFINLLGKWCEQVARQEEIRDAA